MLCCIGYAQAVDRVSIVPFYDPYYVEHGSNMSLTCVTASRLELEWYRETPASGFDREQIVARQDLPFILRFKTF